MLGRDRVARGCVWAPGPARLPGSDPAPRSLVTDSTAPWGVYSALGALTRATATEHSQPRHGHLSGPAGRPWCLLVRAIITVRPALRCGPALAASLGPQGDRVLAALPLCPFHSDHFSPSVPEAGLLPSRWHPHPPQGSCSLPHRSPAEAGISSVLLNSPVPFLCPQTLHTWSHLVPLRPSDRAGHQLSVSRLPRLGDVHKAMGWSVSPSPTSRSTGRTLRSSWAALSSARLCPLPSRRATAGQGRSGEPPGLQCALSPPTPQCLSSRHLSFPLVSSPNTRNKPQKRREPVHFVTCKPIRSQLIRSKV